MNKSALPIAESTSWRAARRWRAVNGRSEKHEMVFSCSGQAGQVVEVRRRPEHLFRVEALEIGDTTGGAGTRIRFVDAQHRVIYRPGSIVCADKEPFHKLSADVFTASVFDRTLCYFLDVVIAVEFLRDCEWQCRLLGKKFVCDKWEEVKSE